MSVDLYDNIVTGNKIDLSKHLPIAIETIFRYMLSHSIDTKQNRQTLLAILSTNDIDCNNMLHKFWALVEILIPLKTCLEDLNVKTSTISR